MESDVKICRICHNRENDIWLCDGLVSVSFAKLASALKTMHGNFDIEFVELKGYTELFWELFLGSQLRKLDDRRGSAL